MARTCLASLPREPASDLPPPNCHIQRLMALAGAEERAQLAEQQRQRGEAESAQLGGGGTGGCALGRAVDGGWCAAAIAGLAHSGITLSLCLLHDACICPACLMCFHLPACARALAASLLASWRVPLSEQPAPPSMHPPTEW